MRKNNFDDTSEEKFLKNRARRKTVRYHEKDDLQEQMLDIQKKSGLGKKIGIAIAIIFSVLLLSVVFLAVRYFVIPNLSNPDEHNTHNDVFVTQQGQTFERETTKKDSKKYYTFLATATDKSGGLTDVIMIARLTYDDKPTVSILQIPRDTYVKISGSKLHFNASGALSEKNFTGSTATTAIKINEVYYRGKNLASNTISKLLLEVEGKNEAEIKALLRKNDYKYLNADVTKLAKYASSSSKDERKTLDNNIRRDFGLYYLQQLLFYHFRIPTDYYAQVNINGFRGIVNAIDGVDLYVPQNMDYDDPYQDLHIHFKKGQQHLNGKKAEEFVRFRSYPQGDVARLDAQKIFIDAFLDKLLSFSTVTKIDDIVKEVNNNLYTSLSVDNLSRFATKILGIDMQNGFEMITLPGVGRYVDGISYYLCYKGDAAKVINEKFNVYNEAILEDDFNMIDISDVPRAYIPVANPEKTEDVTVSTDNEHAENVDDMENQEDDVKDNGDNTVGEGTENVATGNNTSDDDLTDNNDGDKSDDITDNGADNEQGEKSDETTDNTDNNTQDEGTDNTDTQSGNTDGDDMQADDVTENVDVPTVDVPDNSDSTDEGSVTDNNVDASQPDDTVQNDTAVNEQPSQEQPSDNSHLLEEMMAA